MFHSPSEGEPSDDRNPDGKIRKGVHQQPLFHALMAILAFGLFSIGARARTQGPFTLHAEGTVAQATGHLGTSTTSTFTSIYVSRNAQQGSGGVPVVTTNVSYTVCVLTFSTNIQVCQNGYGTIANNELSGDVNYGLDPAAPGELTLNFDSATEPGYLLYAYECDGNGQNCSDVTPSGGLVSVTWRKDGESTTTSTGTSRDTFLNRVTYMSVGQSRYFSASALGTIAGTPFSGGLYPTVLGSVHNFTYNVVFGPQ